MRISFMQVFLIILTIYIMFNNINSIPTLINNLLKKFEFFIKKLKR